MDEARLPWSGGHWRVASKEGSLSAGARPDQEAWLPAAERLNQEPERRTVLTQMAYDANSNTIRLADSNGGTTAWQYDRLDRSRVMRFRDGSRTSVLDPPNDIVGHTDENGSVFAITPAAGVAGYDATAVIPAHGPAAPPHTPTTRPSAPPATEPSTQPAAPPSGDLDKRMSRLEALQKPFEHVLNQEERDRLAGRYKLAEDERAQLVALTRQMADLLLRTPCAPATAPGAAAPTTVPTAPKNSPSGAPA
jgi:YD repeat-containing protein